MNYTVLLLKEFYDCLFYIIDNHQTIFLYNLVFKLAYIKNKETKAGMAVVLPFAISLPLPISQEAMYNVNIF
jgi:hypothetical protein